MSLTLKVKVVWWSDMDECRNAQPPSNSLRLRVVAVVVVGLENTVPFHRALTTASAHLRLLASSL